MLGLAEEIHAVVEDGSVDCKPGESGRFLLADPISKHQEDYNSRFELAELSSAVHQIIAVPEHLQDLSNRSCEHLTPDQS